MQIPLFQNIQWFKTATIAEYKKYIHDVLFGGILNKEIFFGSVK